MRLRLPSYDAVRAFTRYYVTGLFRAMREKEAFLWAQAIGFKVLITLVPIIILATGVVGRVLKQEGAFAYVASLVRDFMPEYGAEQLVEFLGQLQQASGALTAIGAAGLLITATTLFTTLRIVLANVFREEWHEHRSILRGYAFDFRMAIQSGILLGASIAATVFLQTTELDPVVLARFGLDYDWIYGGWRTLLQFAGLVLPFGLSLAMFFHLIWFTPKPHPPLRSAALGAVTTAALWEMAKNAFTAYAREFGAFDDGPFAALGDTFVLVIALVFWAYFSGLVLIIGAIVTLLHETRYRRRRGEIEGPDGDEHQSISVSSASQEVVAAIGDE